jgi:hypothetical protein
MYMTEAYRLRPAGTKEKPTLDNQAWIGRPAQQLKYHLQQEQVLSIAVFSILHQRE